MKIQCSDPLVLKSVSVPPFLIRQKAKKLQTRAWKEPIFTETWAQAFKNQVDPELWGYIEAT